MTLFLCLLGFLACGGGSSSGTPPVVAATLAGTAAAGSPISGTVSAKDARGTLASAAINADGSYSLDVTGLTPPFILVATGSACGRAVALYSCSFSAGTTHVTPITDLILAIALNAPPADAYAHWNGTQVNPSRLAAALAQVRANLQPLFTGAGLGAGANPLTTPFAADHEGMDAALDLLSVTCSGNQVTVGNAASGSSYVVDLADPTAAAGLPESDAAATATAIADLRAINAVLSTFSSLWATSAPTAQQFQAAMDPYLASGYLDNGWTSAATDFTGVDAPRGAGWTFRALLQGPAAVPGFARAYRTRWISLPSAEAVQTDYLFVLNGTTWQMYGNQRPLHAVIRAKALLYSSSVNGQPDQVFYSGLGYEFVDASGYCSGLGVKSALITGPGITGAKKLIATLVLGEPYGIIGVQTIVGSVVDLPDAAIQAIPDGAPYTVNLYSQSGAEVSLDDTPLVSFQVTGSGAPIPKSQLTASLFAAVTAPSGFALASLAIPGQLTVDWTLPAGQHSEGAGIFGYFTGGDVEVAAEVQPADTSALLDTSAWAGIAIEGAYLHVATRDAKGRAFYYSRTFR